LKCMFQAWKVSTSLFWIMFIWTRCFGTTRMSPPMSYRSCLQFVPVQGFLAELWPLDFEIWQIFIGPERNVNLFCNSSLYTHIPNIKSIFQSIAKKSGDN
jgi:hypothetical protein